MAQTLSIQSPNLRPKGCSVTRPTPDKETTPESPVTPGVFLQDRVDGLIRQKRFTGLKGTITCNDPDEWEACLRSVRAEQEKGNTLAGFISYEAGYLLEPKLRPLLPAHRTVPLLWMGIFRAMEEKRLSPARIPALSTPLNAELTDISPEISQTDYEKKVQEIKSLIEAGDIYQANFTFQTDLTLKGHPLDYFLSLTHAQPVPYAAYIDTGSETILSLSPELFFDVDGETIQSRPMKGTAPRGRTNEEDVRIAAELAENPKERAENLMILDLMRNDISRIAAPGSVTVPKIFEVERYRTVHQMTSSVEATLKEDTDFKDILKAIFPCGSITGAPKVRAMEVIADLEQSPRGVYCGAIGHLAPNGDATFNVAIRTLTLKEKTSNTWTGRIGVGGGIVFDSTPEGEFAECEVKLGFLHRKPSEPLHLIETMRLNPDGSIPRCVLHLDRLMSSAKYFDIPYTSEDLISFLHTETAKLAPDHWRLRLLLAQDGTHTLEASPLPENFGETVRIALSQTTTNSVDPLLFHKTSRRNLYDQATKDAAARGLADILFCNERDELTEGAISNLFVERNGKLLTPPLEAGVLPGVLRRELLETGKAEERTLRLQDLKSAGNIFIGNSLRGLRRAILVD